jgi:hypothetical protein
MVSGWIREFAKTRDGRARLLAVAGGLAGLVGVLVAIFVTGLDFVLVIKDENIEVSRTLVGMSWALVGILGGIMSWRDTKIPAIFMLVAGIAGLFTMPPYFAVGGGLLIIGGLMSLTSGAKRTAR